MRNAIVPETPVDGETLIEEWAIRYGWSYGRLGRRWLEAASQGRLIGFRVGDTGKVFLPPSAPVTAGARALTEVPVGPEGTVLAVIAIPVSAPQGRKKLVGSIALDGADVPILSEIVAQGTRRRSASRIEAGMRVRFAPGGEDVRSAADLRFVPCG
jgi:uncharacterized OB-fold protein